MSKRLVRLRGDRMVCGVCSGVANYFDIDPTIVRLITALLIFTTISIWAYIIAAIIIPNE